MNHLCEICKTEITEKEHDYSMKNYHKSLCRKHQKDNSKTDSKKESSNRGLSTREGYYAEGMIK